jgi:hypothetical protein
LGATLALGSPAAPLPAEQLPKVKLQQVVDDRYGVSGRVGALILTLTLEGDSPAGCVEGRAVATEARDDTGRSLVTAKSKEPEFSELGFGVVLRVDLANPARDARSVNVSGTVQLFCPKDNPAAVVKVPNALTKLDSPLVSPGLEAAGIELTPLSKDAFAEELRKDGSPEAAGRIRRQLAGASEEQISTVIEWAADARASAEAGPRANDVYLRAKAADSMRVWSVSVLKANGEEIGDEGRICISDYVTSTCRYKLASPPGPDATLVLTVNHEKVRASFPFQLKTVPLP